MPLPFLAEFFFAQTAAFKNTNSTSLAPTARCMKTAMNSKSESLIGHTIADRYEIIELIGGGTAGQVFQALQWPLRRPVAVKLMAPERAKDKRKLRRFVNEARILCKLKHPNTVSLIDFGRTDDGYLYMVTEYIAGGTLRDLMRGNRLTTVPALRITQQIARALSEAHAHGVIHRDLKPENVLIDEVRSEKLVARVIDFGLAKRNQDSDPVTVTAPRTRLGTPGYMPPEQAFYRKVDPTADLYALGVILYEMVTGLPLFESDTNQGLYLEHLYTAPPPLKEVAPDLDIGSGVEDLIMELLAKDSKQRPSSAKAVVRRIEKLLSELAPPEYTLTPARSRPRCDTADVPLPQTWRSPATPIVTRAFFGGMAFASVLIFIAFWV